MRGLWAKIYHQMKTINTGYAGGLLSKNFKFKACEPIRQGGEFMNTFKIFNL